MSISDRLLLHLLCFVCVLIALIAIQSNIRLHYDGV